MRILEMKSFSIGQLCKKVTSGGTPNTRRTEYYGGNIPWLKTQEVNFNRIYKTETFITEEGLNNSSAKWIPTNSVIVAMYGATAGRIAINKIPLTTNQACCNLIIDSEKADYRYIYYNLLSRFNSIANMAVGGAQQNLNAGMIKELPIDLPDLPTQKAIAEILSSLDDKIELNNQINQNLEALAQALFKQWFVDFEFPNENGEPYKSSGGEMVDSELGEIPKGWRVGEFGELVKIINGFAFKSRDFQEFGESAVIKIKNISANLVDVENTQFIPESVAKATNQKFHIKEGEILIAMTGAEVGKIGITPKSGKKLFLNQRVGKFQTTLINSEMFIYTFFSSFNLTEDVKSRALGSAQPNISSSGIESIKCILPTSNTILDFEKSVGGFYPLLLNNWNEIKTLSNLRDTLLPKLISGELEVNESLLEQNF